MVSAPTQLRYSTLPQQRPPRSAFISGLRWISAAMFWVVLSDLIVSGATYAVEKAYGDLWAIFAPIGLILLLVAGAILASGVRRVRDLSVLHYLEQAIRSNAPLAEMLAAAERDESKAVRHRLILLRLRLQGGEAISKALAFLAPNLPRRIISIVTAGEHTGCLAASLRRVVARRELSAMPNPTKSIFTGWYPLVLFIFSILVMERIAIFNLPKFEMILDYFRVPLPSVMATFKGIDADLWPWVLVFAAGFILLVFSGRMLSQIFTPRGVTLGPLRVVADLLLWYMPLAGGLAQNRGMADICFTLANALDAGLSPNLAIAESAVAGSNIVLERRMRKWAREMLSRREIAPAARVARLPKVLCAMVATTRNAGDLPETLRFLSRYYDGRFSRSAILLRNAILPATAIIGGIVVMLIALGVFQPLVDLIMKMTPKR